MSVKHNQNTEKNNQPEQYAGNPKEEIRISQLEQNENLILNQGEKFEPGKAASSVEENRINDEKEIQFSVEGKACPPMNTTNMKKSAPGAAPGKEDSVKKPKKTAVLPAKLKKDAADAWEKQYHADGREKYRIAVTGGPKGGYGQKRIYMVDDDMVHFDSHEHDEVELDFSQELLAGLTEDSLKEMWKGKFDYVPDGHLPTTDELINIRRRLIADTMPNGDTTEFDNTLIEGADSGATFALLKRTGAWELYRLLDLTHRYYVYQQFIENEIYAKAEAKKRPAVKRRAALPGKKHTYEKQVSANCYGCAGSKLINYLTGENLLDQYKVRNFVPRYLSRAEHDRLVGSGAEDYDQAKQGVDLYAGKGRTRYGNFFGISDVIFDKEDFGGLGRKDIAVHNATYHLQNVKTDTVRKNLIEAMKAKLADMIGSGSPVALLTHGHYVTVIGINDNKITYLDSLPSQQPLGPITKDFETFLNGSEKAFDTVELTWAKKIDPNMREALVNEYGGLGIDADTGEITRTNDLHTDEDVAHRAGIAIKKSREEMDAEGNADISGYLTESVCLHRGAFMTEEQFAAWEERDSQAWEEAKKEQPRHEEEPALISEEEVIITTTIEKKEEPVTIIPQTEEKEPEKELTLRDRYFAIQNGAAQEKFHVRRMASTKGSQRYGADYEALTGRDGDCFLAAVRCMRQFDPKLSDQELCDRYLAMERKLRRPDNAEISKYELTRNVRIMEGLLAQILTVDVEKEFATKDPKEMAELYFKYEPLFTFASLREPMLQSLYAINDREDIPMASRIDIVKAGWRLAEIDSYGKYFAASIKGADEEHKVSEPQKSKLTEKDRMEIIDDIRQRWEGFDERAMPIEAYQDVEVACAAQDQHLLKRLKTAQRGQEANNAQPYNEGLALAVMRAGSINREDDAQSADDYRDLARGAEAEDEEQQARYCSAAERVFAAILSFDLSSLPKEDLFALAKDEKTHRALYETAALSQQIPWLLLDYRRVQGGGKALSEAQLAAVESRCSLFASIKAILSEQMSEAKKAVAAPEKEKGEQSRAIGEAYAALMKKADEEAPEVCKGAVDAVVRKSAEAEQALRENAKARLTATLAGGHSVFVPILSYDTETDGFKAFFISRPQYTQTRREKEMKTAGTELFEKNRLAKILTDRANEKKDVMAKNRRAISFNVRAGLSTEKFTALSAFFTDDMDENLLLTRRLSGKGNRFGAAQDIGDRVEAKKFAYRMLAEKFLLLSVDGLDLSSNAAMAANAQKLEDITQKVCAMKTLMDADPAFIRTLSNEIISAPDAKKEESLYDRVMDQMNRLGRLSDYYRVRKMIMTDSYYLSHYNDEIGTSRSMTHDTFETRYLARLIRMSQRASSRIKNIVRGTINEPVNEAEGEKQQTHWFEDKTFADIAALEEAHRKRAYADGKLDTSLITKESMKTLLQDVKTLYEENPQFSVRKNEKNAMEISKEYSPQLQQMVRQMCMINNDSARSTHVNAVMPGVLGSLVDLSEQYGDDNRIAGNATSPEFIDPATGDHYKYGSHLARDLAYLVHSGAGQLLSREEILELFEGINAEKWKDIDYTDPVQAAAGMDLYLSSMAKLFQLFFNEQSRLEETYGFMPAQLSSAALSLAIGDKDAVTLRSAILTAITDMFRDKSTVVDGQSMSLVDALVIKKYLSRDFVEKCRQQSELMSGINMRIGNLASIYAGYFNPFGRSEDAQIESIPDAAFADGINEHRNEATGPKLTDEEEFNFWTLSAIASEMAGMPEQDKILQESGLRQMRQYSHYTRSMVKLSRFIDSLEDVDTGGHSKEYKHFDGCLKALWECYGNITSFKPANGKNLAPSSMVDLRTAYSEAIKAAQDYLKKKNLNHRNETYRRRYHVVGELLSVMKNDYQALLNKSANISHRLEEALEESHELPVTVASKDMTEAGNYYSKRMVFSTEIDGEKKRVLFMERTSLAERLKDQPQDEVEARTQRYRGFGIPITANIDMRNVAVSIMADAIGTQERIAKSFLGNVRIENEDGKTTDKHGTLTEYIDGLNFYEIRQGLHSGDIVADNETSLLEQLADIQVTDYLCANVNRNTFNMLFVMEDTGKVNEATQQPIKRIKRIVGIGNDLSFGNRKAQSFQRHTETMSIPETMQLISRRTANRILELKKEQLFLTLGATVTEREKEAMWTRVEHMKLAIMDASDKTTQNGLSIVDSFEKYTLKEISGANLEPGNIFRVFDYETDCLGKKDEPVNEKKIPHRLNTREVRLDIVPEGEKETDAKGREWATMGAISLYYNEMQLSETRLVAQLANPEQKMNYVTRIHKAAQEFDRTVGGLFDHVSTNKDYGNGLPHNERMDLLDNEDSILNIFFIDGKPAREVFPQIDRIANLLLENEGIFTLISGTSPLDDKGQPVVMTEEERQNLRNNTRLTARDMLAKAYIMSYIVSGSKQVTIANNQENKYGVEELAITDLNVIIHAPGERPLVKEKLAGADTKLIEKSRKNRETRFKKIRDSFNRFGQVHFAGRINQG